MSKSPARHADALMAADSGFTHRQTLAGVVRFNSPELHEEASRVVEAGAHALAAEAAHAEELTALAVAAAARDHRHRRSDRPDRRRRKPRRARRRRRLVPARARPTSRASRSTAAATRWSKARLRGSASASSPTICALGPSDRLWLITGPNMGGKSTFLRQAALIAVLAQAGSFVPAARATVGIVDRLFSRVGASDNLARGRSTFMVEMVETAAILAQATPHSLVILDEIGRGTSTYDGLAIAWAVVEAMHDDIRCRTLFATHYHELTRLAERLDCLSLHHVRAREWKGDLVLLHEVADGAADRSYGIAVAKLAGLPPAVVARAKVGARQARGGARRDRRDRRRARRFAVVRRRDRPKRPPPTRWPRRSAAIEPDRLTPREALEALYRLKRARRRTARNELPRRSTTAARSSTAARSPTGSRDSRRGETLERASRRRSSAKRSPRAAPKSRGA